MAYTFKDYINDTFNKKGQKEIVGHESHGTTRYGRGAKQNHMKMFLVALPLPIYIGIYLAAPIRKAINYSPQRYIRDFEAFRASGWKQFLPIYFNQYTITFVVIAVVIYSVGYAYYAVKTPHPFKNKEYGTSKLIDASDITKKYSCPPVDKYIVERVDDNGNPIKINTAERRFSENIFITTQKGLPCEMPANNNVLVVGGSGSGKTFRLLSPFLNTEYGSYVVTDPKFEITHHISEMMQASGYRTMCLNFYDEDAMKNSVHYNPWKYVKTETDMMELIAIFMKSTGGVATGDNGFWDQACSGVLEALGYYMFTEMPKEKHTFRTLMTLLDGCNITMVEDTVTGKNGVEKKVMVPVKGPTFAKIEALKDKYWDNTAQVCTHNSYAKFNKFLGGAEDTVANTMATIEGRVKNLKVESVLSLTDTDDIDIPTIGAGVNYDGKTKTFLSIVTSEGSTTFNFLVSMFYLQLWRQLYYYSDRFLSGAPLPIQVSAILDEFYNCTFPEDFPGLLSTFRSRNCDATIIVQDLSQLEERYEKAHKNIKSNCSVFVFLGSNELETCKQVSETLGDQTIYKRNTTEQAKGGDSHNEDRMGRNVMTPAELLNLPKDKCVIRVQNEMPVVDLKTQTHLMPRYKQLCNGKYNPSPTVTPMFREISIEAGKSLINHYELAGEDVVVLSLDDLELLVDSLPDDDDDTEPFNISYEELEENRHNSIVKAQKEEEARKIKLDSLGKEGIKKLLALKKNGFSDEQIEALNNVIVSDEYTLSDIVDMFSADMTVSDIREFAERL